MNATKVHVWAPDAEGAAPLVLQSLGHNPQQEPIDRPRGHRAFHWLATVSGRGRLEWGGRVIELEPRQGVLWAPNWPHRYRASDAAWSTEYLTFLGPLAGTVVATFPLPLGVPLTWSSDSPLASALSRWAKAYASSAPGSPGSRSAELYHFLTLLKDHARPVSNTGLGFDRLAPLWRYVDDHLDDPQLSVDDLARVVHVSSRHLCGLFARAGHVAPYQYLRQRRIARARELLVERRDWGVKEVSYHVGYRDPSHFIYAFRQLVGQTPDQYRRSGGLTAERR